MHLYCLSSYHIRWMFMYQGTDLIYFCDVVESPSILGPNNNFNENSRLKPKRFDKRATTVSTGRLCIQRTDMSCKQRLPVDTESL